MNSGDHRGQIVMRERRATVTIERAGRTPTVDLQRAGDRVFLQVLVNTLLVSVINFTVWFAITFWIYLETRSVLATGMVAGIFLVATSVSGIWFGSLVDHYPKKTVMQLSAAASLLLFAVSFGIYLLTPAASFRDPGSVILWVFVVLAMLGVIAGNVRTIALFTLVTALIPEDRRDKANGLVGTTSGVSFLVTSVISGLLVAAGGMFWVLILALVVLTVALLQLAPTPIPHREPEPDPDATGTATASGAHAVDLRGTLRLVRSVPGLLALIGFTCFNNLLNGAFMALMDAYGLSLMSVQAWGLLWGALSAGFIVGGLAVARTGLSRNPVRLLLLVNLVFWVATISFPLSSSIVLLTVCMAVYMLLVPYAEAAEQTILQRVVPYERQGRVFGFAQSVELAASPLTAFLIGPLTQLVFIPFMTTGAGVDLIGPWFGTGADRGIALVFLLCGILGLIVTGLALGSKYYRQLSARYAEGSGQPAPG
jgi:MFS transporter, DHA3 family, multidrug efflux protein